MQHGANVLIFPALEHRCNPPKALARELAIGQTWRCTTCDELFRLDQGRKFRPDREARRA